MRKLVKDVVDARISRREFLSGMAVASYSATAARSALAAVEPYIPGSPMPEGYTRTVEGTGSDLMVEQILETGAEYMFVANGSGLGPLCDSLVRYPGLTLIQATQEGQVVSIADGYAKASGKVGFGMYSKVGLPHSSSNMYNAMKDRTPLVMLSDHAEAEREGRDGHEDIDDWLETVKQFTKWRWVVHETHRLPEWVRKGYKVAGVMPGGPTHIRIPKNQLYRSNVRGRILSGQALNISMDLPPDPREVERAARFLLAAESPLMQVGFEASQCGAEATLVELAELLSMPVVQHYRSFHCDFPNTHPLQIGHIHNLPAWQRHYPKEIDCFLSLGTRFPPRGRGFIDKAPIIHASVDPDTVGRNTPLACSLVGDIEQTGRALIEAIKSMATPAQLEKYRGRRREVCAGYTSSWRSAQIEAGRRSGGSPVPWQRVMYELNQQMERNAVVVEELGRAARTLSHFAFSRDGMMKVGRTTGMALGWGVGASAGVKLALPDRQVVSIQGDGGFLFGQSDSLWTMSRYDIPVMTVILNNRSYEASRWRIMHHGRSGELNRDYISYLGNPDVDFAKLASVYSIPGEVVEHSEQLRGAIRRGLQTLAEGRPFMLDVRTLTWGKGAGLTAYQDFSLAEKRKHQV